MKAAILNQLNIPLVVGDINLPSKLEVGQVLVEVRCSTICGAQIGEFTGANGPDPNLPHLMGHEGCGRVVEVGPGTTQVKRKDRVVMHWRKGTGIDAPFPKYNWNGKIVGGGKVTTFNECAVVSENRLTPIDEDVPYEIGSLFGCAVTTGLGLINNEAQLRMGQSIAIAGCGGVGLNVVQGAAMVSADPIVAIDKNPVSLGRAALFGATNLIDLSRFSLREGLHSIDGLKSGVDVFVDCTGNVDMISNGYECVVSGGKMILVGQPPLADAVTFPFMRMHYKGKVLLDSQGGLTNPTIDIPRYVKLWRQGKLKLDGLITKTITLDEIGRAFEMLIAGTYPSRIAIKMP